MNYILSEGTLPLPEAIQEQSVTLLRLPKARATLVITRAWDVTPGVTPDPTPMTIAIQVEEAFDKKGSNS